jgi:DNA-binding NarL/FixJ family response regulator
VVIVKTGKKIIFFTNQQLLIYGLKELLTNKSLHLEVEICSNMTTLNKGDLFIVDDDFPKTIPIDNLNFLRKIKKDNRDIPIIFYTNGKLSNIDNLYELGVNAIILKNHLESHNQLISYIKLLLDHPTIIIRDGYANKNLFFNLSTKEIEVLHLICQGKRNKDIAHILHLSIPSVEAYISKIYEKLEVSSRVEAVVKAIAFDIVNLDIK